MSQPKFCAKCGSQLNENERFCGRCGEPVEAVIPEQQSAGSVQTPEYTAVPTAGAEVSGTKDKKKSNVSCYCRCGDSSSYSSYNRYN